MSDVYAFDAFVTAALFDGAAAAFALADGSVHWSTGEVCQAHEGAVLSAAAHPRGGVISGGDDGRVAHSSTAGVETLATLPAGRWAEVVRVSAASGLLAFASGRELYVRDLTDPRFERTFRHERTVADLAFDGKGRRIAVASYGGVWLWLARIADQKPTVLRHAGSHVAVALSPDGRFAMSSMQDNQLHGWKLADGKDMRMGGYPAKVKSLSFMADGALLATSGANGAVVWPFGGGGPMGKAATEVGVDEASRVTVVAGMPSGTMLAAGTDDGRVWVADVRGDRREMLKTEAGAAISALAIAADGRRVAWGDEDGGAGLADNPL